MEHGTSVGTSVDKDGTSIDQDEVSQAEALQAQINRASAPALGATRAPRTAPVS